MKQNLDQGRRFLKLAERDLRAFLVLNNEEDIGPSIIYFHAQQAAEKFLKSVLIAHSIDPKRTHDLNELTYLLHRNKIETPFTAEEIGKLNPYAVIFRYDDTEIETIDRNGAIALIKIIKKWAESQIKDLT